MLMSFWIETWMRFVHDAGYSPPGVVFLLRWQLSPTQVKYTSNAHDSTYILYEFFINIRYSNPKIYCVACPNATKKNALWNI